MNPTNVRHLRQVLEQEKEPTLSLVKSPPPANRSTVAAGRSAARAAKPVAVTVVRHTGYGVAGLWRAGGGGWRWCTAAELSGHLTAKPEMVAKERARRRKVAGWGSLAGLVVVVQVGNTWWPALAIAAVIAFVAAGVVERRLRHSFEPADAGRKALGKHPGSKAVRRAVAAVKLGKFDEIRVVGPVTRDQDLAWMALVEPPEGVTYQVAQKRQAELAAAIGVGQSQVAVDPVKGNNGRFMLWVADSDPLIGAPIQSPLLGTERFDFWTDKIPFGQDVRGRPYGFSMVERTVLISGEPGGGKSVACNDLLCPLALDPGFELDLVDGKQVELVDYEDIARFLLARPDPDAFVDYLLEEQEEIEDRYSAMKRARVKALTREIAEDLGLRPRLLHVDELAFFTRGRRGKDITELLRDRVSRGRAAMLLTSAATQRPSSEVIDTDLRDLISIRVGLRSTTPDASDMGLGRGWAKLGYSTAMFDPMQRGAALVLAEGSVPVRMRTTMLKDKEISSICRRAYRLREAAGTLPKSDTRPAVRLLKAVLAAFEGADKASTERILGVLTSQHLAAAEFDATKLADELRPLDVRPADQWIDGRNQRGYRRVDVLRALDRA